MYEREKSSGAKKRARKIKEPESAKFKAKKESESTSVKNFPQKRESAGAKPKKKRVPSSD